MVGTARRTTRGERTRSLLLEAATDLVAQRGFHAVGINDIGAAAGVSGAAIYRHFENKEALLVAAFNQVVGELLDGARLALRDCDPGRATLDAFIDAHIGFALANRKVIMVYDREAHNLPAGHRAQVRRQQRAYAQIWMRALSEVHPHWSSDDVATAVHGVFGLINSVADYRNTASPALARRLKAMALAALEL